MHRHKIEILRRSAPQDDKTYSSINIIPSAFAEGIALLFLFRVFDGFCFAEEIDLDLAGVL